jgi:hypothetical protein
MAFKQQVESAEHDMKERALNKKAEKLAKKNRKLESQLETERAAEAQLASVVKGSRRRPRLVRGALIAGAAYILGAKAGRHRYEQIMRWAGSVKQRLDQRLRRGGMDPMGGTPGEMSEPTSSASAS